MCAALAEQSAEAVARGDHAKATRCNAEIRNHPPHPGDRRMSPAAAQLDIQAMRADAQLLLTPDADATPEDGLSELTLRMRGHIMRLTPAVEDAMAAHPHNDDVWANALGSVTRAGFRLLEEPPNGSLTQAIAYAQRLARAVIALTDALTALKAAR
ncbi:DUF6415 family natural product biosynthesis protein [Streptomyces sp. PR69]|uniref:DUF6415 family natural product biosynthesis protein n=1 Tax=Streptomyces sp. PR69 TaxID=2984950 RepID=UPI00226412D8|nr:DUF6415 family natural product biosynthesis protein [Streptomyces sp. PR69]